MLGGVRCQDEVKSGGEKLKRHGSFEALLVLRDACETSHGSRGGEAQGRAIGHAPNVSGSLVAPNVSWTMNSIDHCNQDACHLSQHRGAGFGLIFLQCCCQARSTDQTPGAPNALTSNLHTQSLVQLCHIRFSRLCMTINVTLASACLVDDSLSKVRAPRVRLSEWMRMMNRESSSSDVTSGCMAARLGPLAQKRPESLSQQPALGGMALGTLIAAFGPPSPIKWPRRFRWNGWDAHLDELNCSIPNFCWLRQL